MSYEGYTQILTNKGRNFCPDVWEDWPVLPDGECIVWTNGVDTTNGSWENGKRIDGYVDLEIEKPGETCSECGNLKGPNTYKLPPENVGRHRRLEFEGAYTVWHEHTRNLSHVREDHPANAPILQMGKDAIPYILAKLRSDTNSFYLTMLARKILGNGPVILEDERGRVDKVVARWIAWLESKGW